ncbi:MAG: hypothetical protein JWM41_2334 [Gemmatimonadetes bacterium]|nr:hypothetical protein [Gemmatimonadota bacterium]
MAIEGPLRELGIHDVFQLLDLSRKTGMLRVSSELREDEGVVLFDGGRVVQASIRSMAIPTESGAITQKEMERQARLHIESVVFELMSWREGFFSFEERSRDEMPGQSRVTVSTESLLMEGARRIDEWSRIADIVPNLTVVPELAPVEADRDGAMLDLLPHEWQVLTMIDGARDLRAIAAALARDEFEIAKIAYGLATTGVIVLQSARRLTPESERITTSEYLAVAATMSLSTELAAARAAVEQFLRSSPSGPAAPEARDALDALARLQRVLEARANG